MMMVDGRSLEQLSGVLWAPTGLVLILQTSEVKTMGMSPKMARSITIVPFTVYTYPSYP
jgi:hypothetical protein